MRTIRLKGFCWLATSVFALGCSTTVEPSPQGAADSVQDAAGTADSGAKPLDDSIEDLGFAADGAADANVSSDIATDIAADSGSADGSPAGDTSADAGATAKPPTVRASTAYEVITKTDIVYGKAVVDAKWGAAPGKEIELMLDSFAPKAPPGPMPAIVFIHGGGFTGGSRKDANMVSQAKYLAARGWYAVSITYRLAATQGPIPQKWASAAKVSPSPNQVSAMYLAGRDAKAAVRWLHHNAQTLGVDSNHIAIGGGSAGAYTAIGVGLSQPADFRDELTLEQDPTLASTHLGAASGVRAVIDYWGGGALIEVLYLLKGTLDFDATDPPIAIIHGTKDETVSFDEAKKLKQRYDESGVTNIYHPLVGAGHSAWSAKIDGKSLVETAYDFLVKQQGLVVQP